MIHGSGQVTHGDTVINVEYDGGDEEMVWSKQSVKLKHKDDDIKAYKVKRARRIIRRAMFDKIRKEMEMSKKAAFFIWKKCPKIEKSSRFTSTKNRGDFGWGLLSDTALDGLNHIQSSSRRSTPTPTRAFSSEFDSSPQFSIQTPGYHSSTCSFCSPVSAMSPTLFSSSGRELRSSIWSNAPIGTASSAPERVQYPNGDTYDGHLDENKMKGGQGMYKYHNGDVYVGSYRKNLKHGLGRYTYAETG